MRIERLPLFLAVCLTLLASDEAPGWFKGGSHDRQYDMGRDAKVVLGGRASGFIRSNKPASEGFGTYMQMFEADEYRGKRVQFSAMVKAEAVADWAGLWMRIDDDKQRANAFDNMQGREIKGTSHWVRQSVVLDVAADAKAVAIGVLLNGKGSVWINDVRFEVVSSAVPVTNLMKRPADCVLCDFFDSAKAFINSLASGRSPVVTSMTLPKGPRNLTLEPK
jgi:hypothetical protein